MNNEGTREKQINNVLIDFKSLEYKQDIFAPWTEIKNILRVLD